MKWRRTAKTIAVSAWILLALAGVSPPRAAASPILLNGDFQTGNFTGWTLFTTANGSIGDGFFYPKVVPFDTGGTGTPSLSAAFLVGKAQGGGAPPSEGGGLFQDVQLFNGNLTISADIASNSPSNNAGGGLFQLLFDGTVVSSDDFGFIGVGQTERSTLLANLVNVAAGSHEIRVRITRIFGPGVGSTPVQYLDNVALSGSATAPAAVVTPEPASWALFGTAILVLLVGRKLLKTWAV